VPGHPSDATIRYSRGPGRARTPPPASTGRAKTPPRDAGLPAADAAAGAGAVPEYRSEYARRTICDYELRTCDYDLRTPREPSTSRKSTINSGAFTGAHNINRRFSWREEFAVTKHAARLGKSSSEGSLSGNKSRPGSAGSTRKGDQNGRRTSRASERPFAWLEKFAAKDNRRLSLLDEAQHRKPDRDEKIETDSNSSWPSAPDDNASSANYSASYAKVRETANDALREMREALREAEAVREAEARAAAAMREASALEPSAVRRESSCDVRQNGKDLYEQVSNLVEELKAARARAVAAGGQPPRAVEAAASALEPLLRLRDVTGAFTCDLTLMPWLPQLLAVFRNVLHTAVEGPSNCRTPSATPRQRTEPVLSSADIGAGLARSEQGQHTPRAPDLDEFPDVASDILKVFSAGSFFNPASDHFSSGAQALLECEALRERVRHQEIIIRDSQRNERMMQKEVEDLRLQNDELWQRVYAAEKEAMAAKAAEAAALAQLAPSDSPRSVGSAEDPKGTAERLAKHVTGLERENFKLSFERRAVEERLDELVGLVTKAVEDTRRPHAGSARKSVTPRSAPRSPSRRVSSGGVTTTPRRSTVTPRQVSGAASDGSNNGA